jgi:hypothetical protein
MSEGLFENRGDTTGQEPHWDHPDGLGWHLWRRAHSTGLLTQLIQRDVQRFGGRSLMDRAPLADDIRRRWGLDQEPAGDRFHLDVPLFYARFPWYNAGPSEAQPSTTVQSLHRSTDVRSVSVPSRKLPLSEGSGLSKTIQMEWPVHRLGAIDTAFARHGRDLPDPRQTPRLSLHRQEVRRPGAAIVAATDSHVRVSSQAGPRTVGNMQPAVQRLVQGNTLTSDSTNAPSDLQTFTPTAIAFTYQHRVQDSAFIPHRDRLVLRTAMPSPGWPEAFPTTETQTPRLQLGQNLPRSVLVSQPPRLQRRGEQGAPAWPLQHRSRPFPTPLGLYDQALPRFRPQSPRELASTASDLGAPGSRPEYWLASRFQVAERGNTPNAANASFPRVLRLGTTRLHQPSTREERGRHSGDIVMTDVIWRVQTSRAAVTGRPWLSDASQVAEVPGSHQENPVLQRDTGTSHASWTRSQSRVDNAGSVASTSLLLTPPVAGTPVGMLSRTTLWQYHAGSPNPAPTAFTVTRQIAMGLGEGQRPLYWPGALQTLAQHGGSRGVGGMWRALDSGIASTIEPSSRQLQRRATGARRATSGGDAIPGQGWTLPLHVALTLHRQPYARDATLHGFSGRMGTGAGDRAGDSRASLGVMSFVPSYQDHETRLQRFNNAPRVSLNVPTSSPLAPLGELETRIATGTMSLPTLAFRTVQRHTDAPSEPSGDSGSVRPVEEPRSFSPAVSGGSSWVLESSSAPGIGHGGLLQHAASSLGGALDHRQHVLQRYGTDRAIPLIDTTWGETRAAVTDDRSTRASTFWAPQPAASGLLGWGWTAAVQKDSRLGLSVRSSPVLTRAWAGTQAALPILRHFRSQTESSEQAASVGMRQAVSDLPLVLLRRTEILDDDTPKSSMYSATVQTRLQAQTLTPATALPSGSEEETAAVATPTSASQAQVDTDELVEKVWQQLMYKLTIEQERRGYTRWP